MCLAWSWELSSRQATSNNARAAGRRTARAHGWLAAGCLLTVEASRLLTVFAGFGWLAKVSAL